MSDQVKPIGVIEAADHVVALAFKLTEFELENLPKNLSTILQSAEVRSAIEKTLLDFARTKSQTETTVISSAQAQTLFKSASENLKNGAVDAALNQIKSTAQYKNLESGLKGFAESAKRSTLGVWVDRNSQTLYIVGAAVILGGATVLFVTKTGGSLVEKSVDLFKGKNFKVLRVGEFTLKAGIAEFKPDARIFGAQVVGNLELEVIKTEFKLGLVLQGSEVQSAAADLSLTAGQFRLNLAGSAKPQEHVVDLHVTSGFTGTFKKGTFNIGLGAAFQPTGINGTLDAGVNLKSGVNIGANANLGSNSHGAIQGGVGLKLAIDF